MPVLTPAQFKALVRRKGVPAGAVLHKRLATTVQPLSDRQIRFVISTAVVDREGDVIDQGGWDLSAYRLNPVVLWGHRHEELPIGRAIDIDVEDGVLKATVEFVSADMPHVGDLAEAVLRMCQTGFLSATSVGFRPLEFDIANERDDGDPWFPPLNFMRQELLEFSVVSVPCNPEALIELPTDVATLIAQQAAEDAALEEARAAEDERQKQIRAAQRAAGVARRHEAVADMRLALQG